MKKKLILIAAVVLGCSAVVSAQPRAIGGRLAYGIDASYQHQMNGENFIEATLGAFMFDKFSTTGTYNFMIAQPAWTAKGEWGFYAGPGASLSFADHFFSIGLVGQVGLEYTFWFPLQLSVDLRPQIGMNTFHGNSDFYTDGLTYGLIPTVGVRYRF